jgi:hypothetical protein
MTTQRPINDHWLTLISIDLLREEKIEKSEAYVFRDCALDADRRELRLWRSAKATGFEKLNCQLNRQLHTHH